MGIKMNLEPEPLVSINGVQLTNAQTVALRVAVSNYLSDLQDSNLGDDPHGQAVTKLYLARLQEVSELMHGAK